MANDNIAAIDTHGELARAIHTLAEPIDDDECRVTVSEDGLSVGALGSANVSMFRMNIKSEGFSSFEAPSDPIKFGLNLNRYSRAMKFARKGRGNNSGDPVTMEIDEDLMWARVLREGEASGESRIFHIDIDSIRGLPEEHFEKYPKWSEWKDTPSINAFRDVAERLDDETDHFVIQESGGNLVLRDADAESMYRFSDDVDRNTERLAGSDDTGTEGYGDSAITSDYLFGQAKAIKNAGMDRITIRWGVEKPVAVEFSHQGYGLEGVYLTAPRISSDDDD